MGATKEPFLMKEIKIAGLEIIDGLDGSTWPAAKAMTLPLSLIPGLDPMILKLGGGENCVSSEEVVRSTRVATFPESYQTATPLSASSGRIPIGASK
jgi:hypothetical protein